MPRRANATSFGGKAGNPRNTTKPGPGADPETFKARMRLLASRKRTVDNVEKILDDKDHSAFARMFELAADRGYGKPVSAENVRDRVKKTLDVIRAHCSAEQANAIMADLRPVWQ